jgi:hypothetical protein
VDKMTLEQVSHHVLCLSFAQYRVINSPYPLFFFNADAIKSQKFTASLKRCLRYVNVQRLCHEVAFGNVRTIGETEHNVDVLGRLSKSLEYCEH